MVLDVVCEYDYQYSEDYMNLETTNRHTRNIAILFLQDGDRRWARREGVSYAEGYRAMAKKIALLVDYLHTQGITKLYLPTNSVANLSRPPDQVTGFFEAYLKIPEYTQLGVKIVLHGNFDLTPPDFKPRYQELERITSENNEFTLHLLLNWSTLDELTRIMRKLQTDRKEVTPATLIEYSDIPEKIDLIIRTGKVRRLSSFIPLSGEYAELYFMDILFPDLTESDIQAALDHYFSQERTLGV